MDMTLIHAQPYFSPGYIMQMQKSEKSKKLIFDIAISFIKSYNTNVMIK